MKPLIHAITIAAAFALVTGCSSPRGSSNSDEAVGDAGKVRNGSTASHGYVRPQLYPVGDYRNVLSDPGPF